MAVYFSEVIHLRCPKDPGWWYWNNSCYFVESTKLLTWVEAKNFCMAYHETKLLPEPRNEEKVMCPWMYNWKGISRLYNNDCITDVLNTVNFSLKKVELSAIMSPPHGINREPFYSFFN